MIQITRSTLSLFGFDLHWYGLLIALGVLAAAVLAMRREKAIALPADTAINITLICVPAAIICARIYYVAFSWDYYAAHPDQIFNIRQGGMAIYGGVIGGVLAGYLYCRIRKISFRSGLDLAAPSIALGQAIGRWGNFLNQEAYGRAVHNPRLQFFPVAVQIEGQWHYAAFFYESIWCLLVTAFLLIGEKKRFFRRRGDLFCAYAFLYGIERALVEGLRTDSLYLGSVRVSQMLSLIAVLAIALGICMRPSRLPMIARCTPVIAVLLLGAALWREVFLISAALALILPCLAAVIYIASNDRNNLR